MSRPTSVAINLTALKHNLQRVRYFAPNCSVMAMIKANAYGHGITRVAHALNTADAFGVASFEEGVKLREAGIKQPIVLIEGLFQPDELAEVIRLNFTLVVHHLPHIEILEKAHTKPLSIWLKINTGMNRLGFSPEQVPAIYQRLMACPSVQKPLGLMTHFACADELDNQKTQIQTGIFNKVTTGFPCHRSLANSAGIIAWKNTHGDWVRPGLMLYGASPFPDKVGEDHGLLPVMTLRSRLIAIHQLKKGDVVGYGSTWAAPKDTLIGVVGVGYGDGYPQFAENGTPLLIRGVECPLAGRVSMDMLTVDLGALPDAKVDDKVILWGDGLPVERIAKHCHTTAYEVLTRMTPRPKIEIRE